ncbi:MAG TPA: 23S rRNA (pseudouridine(1915)-N(3))-methyltransferase RlmH [Bacteroidales bacterium]|jgi:23S rRNA (pseudouridine1915-N3)-methyltransferase|nr:23S rRNA (pseudouridine(1915)-N(3))-methyltransferase RlmH [Bacteroidales bacterium]
MKVTLINVGVTQDTYLKDGIAIFEKRLSRYISFEMINLNEPRNLRNQPEIVQKETEGKMILSALEKTDRPVLLDVSGKQMNSEKFSQYMQLSMNSSIKNLGFITGGPYGFSDEIYRIVKERISLSSMTFSHQMIRLIFMEQLYRAFTILKGEPYHHA